MKTLAVVGSVGIPTSYGGFETLAENLARFHQHYKLPGRLVVYCSAKSYALRPSTYLGAKLRYVGLNANGVSSIFYDVVSLLSAIRHGSDAIVLLGVSGATALPLVRLLSQARIVTNIDGIEWKREKWKGLARWFLRFSEKVAVRFSHAVIADNGGIAQHVVESYGRDCHVIAYGGDHALSVAARPYLDAALPTRYALALCRIEPENNVAMVLEAFAAQSDLPLVFVGNWQNSHFGQVLRQRYAAVAHLHFLDPIYDLGVLRTLRENATLYIHGHSAGGTNPSLVEMMHFGLPILAYDCIFNRHTTDGKALFFKDAPTLSAAVNALTSSEVAEVGASMRRIALERYTWDVIGTAYFRLAGMIKGE
ncbi:MAG: glycosyl transferase [Desulfatitalea sp. BRH_c12]|nr:MAG: glycosyl transferase [Desulfatitalea sp. BRH_c12]